MIAGQAKLGPMRLRPGPLLVSGPPVHDKQLKASINRILKSRFLGEHLLLGGGHELLFFFTWFKWATEEYFETLACNYHIIPTSYMEKCQCSSFDIANVNKRRTLNPLQSVIRLIVSTSMSRIFRNDLVITQQKHTPAPKLRPPERRLGGQRMSSVRRSPRLPRWRRPSVGPAPLPLTW